MDSELKDMDLYGVLEVRQSATEKEVSFVTAAATEQVDALHLFCAAAVIHLQRRLLTITPFYANRSRRRTGKKR